MTQSEAPAATLSTTSSPIAPLQGLYDRAERRLRRISAWLILFFLLQGELGAVWDREWHAYVGRDQFWTPPHTLIYSCVSGAGLVALVVVLLDTIRYRRRRPGVDDASTFRVFGLFHAPLGYIITGFGALLALVSAPLDNYWHELYGIDIALWAPFHMMGVTGGMIGILGIIYIFASEAAIERKAGTARRRILGFSWLELGALMTIASLMNFTLTGFLQFPLFSIGPLHISTYPLPLAVAGAFAFVGAIRLTGRWGVSTLLVLFLLAHTLITELFIPWAIRTAVAQQDLQYRVPGSIPYFSLAYALLPLLFLVSALILDGMAYRKAKRGENLYGSIRRTSLLCSLAMIPAMLIAPFILQYYSPFAFVFLPEPGVGIAPGIIMSAILIAIPAALLAGALGGVLGVDFGDIWHWNVR